jgi:ATP-dependent RNA helicase SUPV3L1/SUV3
MQRPPHTAATQVDSAKIVALLGPTNTGKTHRAIERMLELESGMIGLPLRLLAREVYDRVSARVGEQAVALITGEEKRVPARPRYWICTVEAMPLDLARGGVDFLAIDEIQLITHRERGHVFTDRLLHARGRVETWFLGSDTVATLLREQLGCSEIGRLPRLSQLRYAGQASVRTLPRRSAVVAFSMQQVYSLADLIRVRRGGAAVVLGALSPRVRNAQVAMYQAGEVDFLVATDAIGMGLNLDLDHVALASQLKFDGQEQRELELAELGQIVGRAGRYLRDGSFGTLSPLADLPSHVVQQLESHSFPRQRHAYYRNSELDFSGLSALRESLLLPPPHPSLRSVPNADDLALLDAFCKRAEVVALCDTDERVALLWDVCRIPNYEKRLPEHQVDQLVPVFQQLVQRGRMAPEYLHAQLRKLERYDGDIDVLLARLAGVRTWLYVSHQSAWTDQPLTWQARARALEDQLSDTLHARLLTRFVSNRAAGVSGNAAVSEHHPFAKLATLSAVWGDARPDAQLSEQARWVERVVQAGFAAFELNERAEILFEGERVARLKAGASMLSPNIQFVLPDGLDKGSRTRIERRVHAHMKDVVSSLLAPISSEERAAFSDSSDAAAALRGLLYQLEQGLGCARRAAVAPQIQLLTAAEHRALQRWGVVLGRASVFVRDMLQPERLRVREALCYAWVPPVGRVPRSNAGGASCFQLRSAWDKQTCLWRGYVAFGSCGVRCDLVERVLGELQKAPPDEVAVVRGLLQCDDALAEALLRAIPKQLRTARAGARKRRRRKRRERVTPASSS